eukprot:TRINITY_DN2747_c0_g1_i2.p1 TRINITY_DN2747_c0_g1~~TRINITY_DN2747_c0_g1_i2.p1  ORF type:complete len:197 (-),score=12.85 TRINITY_DN2747_c0_g1_i2:113-676(-)
MCIRDSMGIQFQSKQQLMARRYTRLFITNAKSRSGSREIEKIFKDLGNVTSIELSGGKGYVEYENSKDAERAIKELDNTKFAGERLGVEYAVKSTNDFMRKKREKFEQYKKEGRCYKCGKRAGHIAKDCDEGKNRSRSRGSNYSDSRSRSRSRRHKKRKERRERSSKRKRYSRSRSYSRQRGRRSRS